MKVKNQTIRCDGCGLYIHITNNEEWKLVLNKAKWKWCGIGRYERLMCDFCTELFESEHNINPKTGMTYENFIHSR